MGSAARLRVRAKYRAEAASTGPAPAAGCGPRHRFRASQCARPLPPRSPRACLPAFSSATCSQDGVALSKLCRVGPSYSHCSSQGPRPPRGSPSCVSLCPRVLPLLSIFTVFPATLPDLPNSAEASNYPGLLA